MRVISLDFKNHINVYHKYLSDYLVLCFYVMNYYTNVKFLKSQKNGGYKTLARFLVSNRLLLII